MKIPPKVGLHHFCVICGGLKHFSRFRKDEAYFNGERGMRCIQCNKRMARIKEIKTERAFHQQAMSAIGSARGRAYKNKLPYDLYLYEEEIAKRFEPQKCEMTGIAFEKGSKKTNWNSPSIDRKDPEKGYVYSNIRIICHAYNVAMNTWGEEILMKMVDARKTIMEMVQ